MKNQKETEKRGKREYRPVERLNILCGDGIGEYGDNAAAAAKTSDRV